MRFARRRATQTNKAEGVDGTRLGSNRCDAEQEQLLRQCAEQGDAAAWNDWRKSNQDTEIWLQGVQMGNPEHRVLLRRIDLSRANLARAKLPGVVLVGANLRAATLRGADLREAILVDADLSEAGMQETDIRGTNLRGADLRGTSCRFAKADGETLLLTHRVDRATDFIGVALDNTRIGPGLKQLLQYNVRRGGWQVWYEEHPLLALPTWLFWQVSDYGRSTWRILLTFLVLAVAFAVAYMLLPDAVVTSELAPGQALGFSYSLYLSIATMTTLGLGDLYASPGSVLGQALLSIQVVLGYVLLGSLVTRFALLFSGGGPCASFHDQEPLRKP